MLCPGHFWAAPVLFSQGERITGTSRPPHPPMVRPVFHRRLSVPVFFGQWGLPLLLEVDVGWRKSRPREDKLAGRAFPHSAGGTPLFLFFGFSWGGGVGLTMCWCSVLLVTTSWVPIGPRSAQLVVLCTPHGETLCTGLMSKFAAESVAFSRK